MNQRGTFRAYRIHEENRKVAARFEDLTLDDLSAGEVVIRVSHSGINYKDALAATGAGRILRRYPLVGGIDLAGVVESSTDARYAAGDAVLVTGCGLSETVDGGYSEIARVKGDALIPMPPGLDAMAAMTLGTAGFTAAQAIHLMLHNGLAPASGPVAVTGATGGVGCVAVEILAKLGFQVVAITGKAAEESDWLKSIGAAEVLARQAIDLTKIRPLGAATYAGAVDNLGGDILAWLLSMQKIGGTVAAVGLAADMKLNTTVAPFILRGVHLLGTDSANCPMSLRQTLWNRLAVDWRPDRVHDQVRTIDFEDLPTHFDAYLKGMVRGRTVVRIGRDSHP